MNRSGVAKPKKAKRKKNGHGGLRDGAGRPPAKLPKQLLARLGPMPDDVLKQDAWWAKLIAILQWGDLTGEPWAQKLERACRASAQAARLREGEIKARYVELVEAEQRETNEEIAPHEVAREKDPIAAANRTALRIDPP